MVQPEEDKAADDSGAAGERSHDKEALEALSRHVERIKNELAQTIVGQQEVIEQLLVALLAGGHVLLVGVPGLAKTLLVSSLARSMDLTFHRIQFTPDLMPPDITGTEVLQEDRSTGAREFRFIPGPIFANVVLADEINRTPPKTQAALLEAMQEHQVTAAGRRHDLPSPFFVLATQNPIEQEGTYPLPEAQLDRFMFNVLVDYPDQAEEVEIVLRTTSDHVHQPQSTVSGEELLQLAGVVRRIAITPALALTATQIARLTRPRDAAADDLVRQYVRWGAGPRASQYIVLGAKARAAMHGSPVVRREDIEAVAPPVLRHRMRLNFQAEAAGISVEEVIQHVLSNVDRSLESGPTSEQLAKVLRS
ncbi:MAG: AAA family ATPase [Planctomycetota bacterium]|nr:MAG: AAA family ATPase [Planctomycetota bacterium]